MVYDTVIIGSGPAGLTAAIYNVRANLKTVVIAGNQPGGQLTITTKVENWPGFENGVDGIPLMMAMQKQAVNLGAEIKDGLVEGIEKKDKAFVVKLKSGEEILGMTLLVATGAAAKWLHKGEEKFMGKGVSGCATCDGAFFRNKVVAVVGGGDSAVEEATFLTRFASKVYVIHRRAELRAKAKEQERLLGNPKVEMVWNSEISKIIGDKVLEGVEIVNNQNQETKILKVEGLFVAIGGLPATEFIKNLAETKETGHLVTGKNPEYPAMTSVAGIFAAGDCVDENYKQAITSAGDGCKAAMDLQKWLLENEG